MAISAGTYVIACAGGTGFVLDSNNDHDDSGTQVVIWDRYDDDAQIVRLVKSIYGDYWVIQFALSGKVMVRASESTSEGALVKRGDWIDDDTVRWRIVPDGKTVTIGGASYPTYYIKHKTADLCIDVYNNEIVNGQKTAMYLLNGGNNQRWVFIPQKTISNGTYEIRPAINNNYCVDVANNSTAAGARVQVYTRNDTNAQKWVVQNLGDSLAKIVNANTGFALDAENWGTSSGTKVITWYSKDQDNQKWLIEPSTAQGERNDQPSALYRIHHKNGTGKVLDVSSNGALGAYMQLYDQETTSSFQLFQFVPTEYTASDLPVPASLDLSFGVGLDKTHSEHCGVEAGSTYSLNPHFVCSGTTYQMRYRMRTRSSGQANSYRGSWSAWRSISDNSTSNGGWGEIQKSNCTTTNKSNHNWAKALTGTLSNTGTDLVEYEYQVRRFSSKWGSAGAVAHGNSATGKGYVKIRPTVSGVSATLTPDGLAITYTSSFPRSNNTINVECSALWSGRVKTTGANYSGTVVVPYNKLKAIPEDGSKYSFTVRVTTCDDQWDYASATTCTVSYDGDHGTSVGATSVLENSTRYITVDGTASVFLIDVRGHGSRFVELQKDSKGRFVCAAPFNKKYKVYIVKGTIEGSSAWATKTITYDPIVSNSYHLTALDGSSDFELVVGKGDSPSFSPSYERSMTLTETTGREREIAGLAELVKASWGLTGALAAGYGGDTIADADAAFDKAAHMGYCYFRAPNGFWAPTVIKSAEIDMQHKDAHEVTFGFEEVEV